MVTSATWRRARFVVLAALLVAGGSAALYLSVVLQQRTELMTRHVRVDVWARHRFGDGADVREYVLRRPPLGPVAATSHDPAEAVESGRLREDLYYHLNVVPLRMRYDEMIERYRAYASALPAPRGVVPIGGPVLRFT